MKTGVIVKRICYINRPIRVAYIVPCESNGLSHEMITAIFDECRSRWCGFYSPIIIANAEGSIDQAEKGRLGTFDPDYIYSYVGSLSSPLEDIYTYCDPCEVIYHRESCESVRVEWGIAARPMSSLPVIASPKVASSSGLPRLASAGMTLSNDLFLCDNFGNTAANGRLSRGIEGLFETYALEAVETPHSAWDWTTDREEFLSQLFDSKIVSPDNLCINESERCPPIKSGRIGSIPVMVLGSSLADRIDYWNHRLHEEGWLRGNITLRIDMQDLQDQAIADMVRRFYVRACDLSRNQYIVRVHSRSVEVSEDVLSDLKKKMKGIELKLMNPAGVMIGADEEGISDPFRMRPDKIVSIPDDSMEYICDPPMHMNYLPPRFSNESYGAWAQDVMYGEEGYGGEMISGPLLPVVPDLGKLFSNKRSRIGRTGRLSIIVGREDFPGSDMRVGFRSAKAEISIPSEATLITQAMLLSSRGDDAIVSARMSDKGQNTVGALMKLGGARTAYNCFVGNCYLRDMYFKGKDDSGDLRCMDYNWILSRIPTCREYTERLCQHWHIQTNHAKNIKDALVKDSLSFLVAKGVLRRVYHWRCDCCGHDEMVGVSGINEILHCSVCKTESDLPIDFELHYLVDEFLWRTLVKHSGMFVLWALGFLARFIPETKPFIPEVSIEFSNGDSCEIDLIGIIDGGICICEVKKSAGGFFAKQKKEDGFIRLAKSLKNARGMLFFGSWGSERCDDSAIRKSCEAFKGRFTEEVGSQLEVIVVADHEGEVYDFGHTGPRTWDVIDKCN